ncbi:MAG: hypothetical protein IT228_07615 [Flavobacteriales bacterium]|nr:hypothetical protein [Flavobacteriales bacterium]MCC6577192.1 hypothetical protein [Flavobacteriales bacterium]NUQ15480.1 hypothetical protein [Flavobacteriales bacterium]
MSTRHPSRSTLAERAGWTGPLLLLWAGLLLGATACTKFDRLEKEGCTEQGYANYDPYAELPDGSCCTFRDAGSRIWRGTVVDTITNYGFEIPYVAARIVGELEGPCLTERGSFWSVQDDHCGQGPCVLDLGVYSNGTSRTVDAYGIDDPVGCCIPSIVFPPNVNYINVTFKLTAFNGSTPVQVVEQDARFDNNDNSAYFGAIPVESPQIGVLVDSLNVKVLDVEVH